MSVARKKPEILLVDFPVEVLILRDGRRVMSQIFQHTPIRFGRILENDVVLPFDGVSRHHCELRFEDSQWSIQDLKSTNGVVVKGEVVASAKFETAGEFEVGPIVVQMRVVPPSPIASAQTLTDTVEAAGPERISTSEATVISDDPQSASGKRLHAEKPRAHAVTDRADAYFAPTAKKTAVLEINGAQLMGDVYPMIEKAKSLAVQVTILWHDIILNVVEFVPGEPMIIEINGASIYLGRVGRDRSEIRTPKGTTFLDRPGHDSILSLLSPATWMAQSGIQILARYVPQSRNIESSFMSFVENELVDPLVVSGVVHGALALATVTMTVKASREVKPAPERIALIIAMAPRPPPKQIAMAIASPTPRPIVRSTPKRTPLPKPNATPKLISIATPRPTEKAPRQLETKVEQIVAVRQKPAPIATPAPKPFDASSFGALKALSALSASKPEPSTNIEKIIVRKMATTEPANENAPPLKTTSDMMADLPKQQRTLNQSVGGLSLPVAAGKDGYGTAGYSTKTGKRSVMGSVIGGATFTEIQKSEGLPREQVTKVVEKHQSQIQQCYERALKNDPTLAGRAEFEWEISSSGSVITSSVNVKETNLKNAGRLMDCVKNVFRKMQFPKSKNGETTTPTIGLPFGRL